MTAVFDFVNPIDTVPVELRLPLRNEYASSKVFVAGSCMCLFAWLILGLIAGWFVASQGVNNGGASAFRPPPPQVLRPPYDNHSRPRRNPCPCGKRYIPRPVSPEIVEPVQRQDSRARDRMKASPSINRPGILRVALGPPNQPSQG
jgi:hypothetical protein